MAILTLYGSSVADATLTSACDMALNTTGGSETTKITNWTGSVDYGEVTSQGNASLAGMASMPAIPTGLGWAYKPGAGTFAAGNWLASINFACTGVVSGGTFTLRFFKLPGGVLASAVLIGTIVTTNTAHAETEYSFAATSMPSTVFGSSDLLYIDLWQQDVTTINGDTGTIYLSTSSLQGVPNDFQITTSSFLPTYSLITATRATYPIKMGGLAARARATFYTRMGGLAARARATFAIAYALKSRARALFRVGPRRVLSIVLATPVQHINAVLSEVAMTTPNTTIDSSATVKDQNAALISNLSACTLAVAYQDGTSAAPSVTNMGSGVYTATYATKGAGVLTETWSFTDTTGAIASEQRALVIAY